MDSDYIDSWSTSFSFLSEDWDDIPPVLIPLTGVSLSNSDRHLFPLSWRLGTIYPRSQKWCFRFPHLRVFSFLDPDSGYVIVEKEEARGVLQGEGEETCMGGE